MSVVATQQLPAKHVAKSEGLWWHWPAPDAGFPVVFVTRMKHPVWFIFGAKSMQMFQYFLWFHSKRIWSRHRHVKSLVKWKLPCRSLHLYGKCFSIPPATVLNASTSVFIDFREIQQNPEMSYFIIKKKNPSNRFLRNFCYNIQNILLRMRLNQDTWWPSVMNFLHNVWVKQDTQTRKYVKHMLMILITYDCRTCWAVFTFRAHKVHFFQLQLLL